MLKDRYKIEFITDSESNSYKITFQKVLNKGAKGR